MTDYSPPPFGIVCQRCGLSDFGRDRMRANGFDPKPCRDCADHFEEES